MNDGHTWSPPPRPLAATPLYLVAVAAVTLGDLVTLYVTDADGQLWAGLMGAEGWQWHRVKGPTVADRDARERSQKDAT